MPSVLSQAPATQLRITLPDELAAQYQAQADLTGVDIEDLITQRLAHAVDYTSSKPLYFSDSERSELEKMLGKNILHTKDALNQIRILLTVRIHNLKIFLSPALLTRLKSRCLGMVWENFIQQRIVIALEQYVGLR